ncbi:type II toxin-antitoxin system death-on-curing family toxin [Nocardiopsis sp. YSL2]|uniref:type II toxin-antitoxin system death-on-curing family toxin n=1 Tax=Nocardiopsis sp. YSL2 TaxID=2939492 RepID=UPI0026F41B7C|nr:type II toxin-antitoxin system death-on-curing family toxin [Nocardiopsis sp. YSL2]
MSDTGMMVYLTRENVLRIAEYSLPSVKLRDETQLLAALQRPRASAFEEDAYPDVWEKAAALMQAIAIGHPLVDGNKRLAWLSTDAFLSLNGVDFDYTDEDSAYDLVIAVTTGELVEVHEIAVQLRKLMPTSE